MCLSLPYSDWCSQVEGRVPAEMKEVFGPEVLKHTLVLLTCGDYLAGQTEEVTSFYSTIGPSDNGISKKINTKNTSGG